MYYKSITLIKKIFKVRDDLVIHKNGKIYMVQEKDDSQLTCRQVRLEKVRQEYVGLDLPFNMVGIHQYGGLEVETVNIQENELKGKAMMCGQVVAEWMPQWTMSKIDY